MHVDVRFPTDRPPLPCFLEIMDLLEDANRRKSRPIGEILHELDEKRASLLAADEDENPDIIMGDWQTWK